MKDPAGTQRLLLDHEFIPHWSCRRESDVVAASMLIFVSCRQAVTNQCL